MDGGFQFFDIILLALIAVFIILRLRNVLGRRDGHEGGYQDPFAGRQAAGRNDGDEDEDESDDNIIRLPDRSAAPEAPDRREATGEAGEAAGNPIEIGLVEIGLADSSFERESFLHGAKSAFEMIVGAFAAGDRETLRNLLSPDVYANFEQAIAGREANGETMEHELVGLRPPEIVEAGLAENSASITCKFVSEQVNVVRDGDGKVVEGDPTYVEKVTDFWTFSRNVKSRDPNWTLVATHSPS